MAGSFFTNVTVNLVSKLGEYLFAPIGRQFGYVLCYKSHVEDLQNEVKELGSTRERVQHSVNEARNNAKRIHTDVEDWLGSVTKEAEEAQNLLERGKNAKNACFRGWIPNPVVRHPIGRKVKETTGVIKGLLEKSRNSNFKDVYYENTPPGIVTATTSATRSVDKKEDPLESRALIIDDVMKAIADDKIHVIGVYGPGGVGKSKLLEDIKSRVREEKLFDEVAMADVSRNPDIKRIQGEIADELGLKLNDVETDRGRAAHLHKRLECDPKKRILIVLDDLWNKLELKEVGIPSGDDNNKARGYHGEARRLFERTLGYKVNDLEFKISVDEVVKKCAGLPLYIVSSAKRLKRGNSATWRTALDIEGSDLELYVELNYKDIIDERIKSVFLVCALRSGRTGRTSLRDSLVYCMGLDLYENFNETIEKARDWLRMDLRSLQDSSLLLDSDDKKWFRMHDIFVDGAISIARKEWNALVGAKGDEFEKWSEDELRKCKAMSLRHVGIEELPKILDCPNLKMLLLFEHNPSLKIPPSFFESTRNLQVLDITGLSFTSLPSSIEVLENLKSLCLDWCYLGDVTILGKLKGLQMLSFFHSTITFLPKEIGGLTKLRFLDLTGCTKLKVIEPGVLGSLANLEELYMEDSFDQWEADDEAPCKNVSLAELKNMKNLSTLYIAIPRWVNLLRDLPFGKLNKHIIQIGEVWDGLGEHKVSRTLKLKLDSGNLLHEEWVQKCLQRTQDLHLDGLQDGNNSIHDLCVEGFQELKYLHVQNSPSFRYVVHSEENVQRTAFTTLVSLFLENLNNLEKICCGHLALESFGKLKIVKVDDCGEIKHLFPLSMTRTLSQLEEIEISRCHLMQQIVANAEAEDGDEIHEDPKVRSYNLRRLTLPNLPKITSFYKNTDHSIDLFDAHQVFPSNLMDRLQSLNEIEVVSCPSLEALFEPASLSSEKRQKPLVFSTFKKMKLSDLPSLRDILRSDCKITLAFPSLMEVNVRCCHSLPYLFSSATAKTLDKLATVDVSCCNNLQGIIAMEEGKGKTINKFKFRNLTTLKLGNLENLICFNSESCDRDGSHPLFDEKVQFPVIESMEILQMSNVEKIWIDELALDAFSKLKTLRVEYCEKLASIFSSDTNLARFRKLEILSVTDCDSLEVIFLVEEKNMSRAPITSSFLLRELNLERLPKLKHVWSGHPGGTLKFECLKCFKAIKCESLQSLFPSSVAKSMTQLEQLLVASCGMEEIIAEEDGAGTREGGDLFFPGLTELTLVKLPKLRSFYKNTSIWPLLPALFHAEKMPNVEKIWTDELASNAFSKLKTLRVQYCKKLASIFSSDTILARFHNLKELTVTDCGSLEMLFPIKEINLSTAPTTSSFLLRELNLERLPKLKHVWSGHPGGTLKFECLECFKATECESLQSLFPSSVAMSMTQLEQLLVTSCGMEEIIAEEDGARMREGGDLFFPGLTKLTLVKLPELRSFYKNTSIWPVLPALFHAEKLIKLQNLEVVTVERCQLIQEVFDLEEMTTSRDIEILWQLTRLTLNGLPSLERIWSKNPGRASCFRNLKALKVENCENLRFLFSSSMAKALVQINEIKIASCVLMEEIMHVQEEELEEATTTDTLEFPLLTSLSLVDLPNLKTFSYGKYCIHYPSLTRLTISGCPKMMTFSSFEGKQQSMTTDIGLQQALGRTNSGLSLPGFFNEKVLFPSLKELKLSSMCQLKRLWHNQLPEQSLCKLASLTVELCENLSHVFPSNSMDMLQSLNKIEAVGCPSLEALFEPVSLSAEKRQKQLVLPALRNMTLLNLPMLRDISKSDCKITMAFPSLMEVNVRGCHNLPYLFTSATSKTLDKLVELDVSCCNNLQGIIAMEEGKGKIMETFKFCHLSMLKLGDLKNLISFCSTSCASDRLHPLFDEKQGRVLEAKVVYDRDSGRSRGFGFVSYGSADEVNNAIDSLNGVDLDGRTIRVTHAEAKPRRQF
ncbi:hypothetical protein BT93_K1663 [Corymbia citriodora subsp. variegata]|nr:hypothetical protein BT93_K1663 [Corymbia citriodora subsp. variegata]KAF8007739.1 hypothetical protein BT93_K1663 [Corymbia citriodora subsp. variegata]